MAATPTAPSVTQHFHSNVGAVAGRDINVNVSVFLKAIARHIESSAIPEAEKQGILARLRELAEHPIIAGLATNAIWQMISGTGG